MTDEDPRRSRLGLAGVLIMGALVLPLLFTTSLDDTFALPKAVALRVIVALGLGVIGIRVMRSGAQKKLSVNWIDTVVVGFVLLNIAAFMASNDRAQSLFGERLQWQGLLTIAMYVASYFLARTAFKTERSVTLLFGAVLSAGAMASLYAIAQWVGLDPIWDELPNGRVFSTLGQPNWLAAYLVLSFPVALSLVGTWQAWRRWMAAAVSFLIVLSIALTQSRGGYLGLLAATGTFFGAQLLWGRMRVSRVRTIALVGVVVVSLAIIAGPSDNLAARVWDRGVSSFDLDAPDIQQYFALWEVGSRIAMDNLWLGAGQETYPELFGTYRDQVLDPYLAESLRAVRPESPHNVYIATAAGVGLPALLVYLTLIFGFTGSCARAISRTEDSWRRVALLGILASIAGHLVTDFFMTGEIAGSWLFWVLMGVGANLLIEERAYPA